MRYNAEVKYGLINHSIMLKEVEVKDKKGQPLKTSSNLNGPGNADQVIRASDLAASGCATIADCLQGRISGEFAFDSNLNCKLPTANRKLFLVC